MDGRRLGAQGKIVTQINPKNNGRNRALFFYLTNCIMKILERERHEIGNRQVQRAASVEEIVRAHAKSSVAEITASLPVVPSMPTIDWDALEEENGTGKHMLRALLRTPFPDFAKLEPELDFSEDKVRKTPVEPDDFIWADLVSRATSPDASSNSKPDIREIEALFGLPSYDPENDSVIKIVDDEKDPRNSGLSISQTTLDIPLQWKELIEKVDASTHSEKIKDGSLPPARARIKTTFAAVLAHLKDGMQPELMPGTEAEAILQYPEPLTDREIKVLLANPNKQFVSLFVTLCLTMQNPDAPILKPVEKVGAGNPKTEQVFDVEAQQGAINLNSLAQQVMEIVSLAKPKPVIAAAEKPADLAPAVSEVIVEEDWNKRGAILPSNLGPDLAHGEEERSNVLETLERYPENIKIYKQAEKETGVPWQILAAIHYREGGGRPNTSVISGRVIGKWEPDVERKFDSLLESAIYGADILKGKVGGDLSTPAQIAKALTRYNGGGNKNYGRTDYSFARRFVGDDDPYVTNLLDAKHGGEGYEMYVLYCEDGIPYTKGCPRIDYRPGVYTIIKWIIQSGKFN